MNAVILWPRIRTLLNLFGVWWTVTTYLLTEQLPLLLNDFIIQIPP